MVANADAELKTVEDAAAAQAKTLVYCSEGSPENFNPQINTTGTSFDTAYPIFNRLVEFEPGTTNVKPGLAKSWDVSDDGLTYTFKLRDHKWSDGTPVTAEMP